MLFRICNECSWSYTWVLAINYFYAKIFCWNLFYWYSDFLPICFHVHKANSYSPSQCYDRQTEGINIKSKIRKEKNSDDKYLWNQVFIFILNSKFRIWIVFQDLIQTVYNWQFIQCLYLWATVISRVARSEDRVYIRRDDIFQRLHGLMELAYPLCQITIATFKCFVFFSSKLLFLLLIYKQIIIPLSPFFGFLL